MDITFEVQTRSLVSSAGICEAGPLGRSWHGFDGTNLSRYLATQSSSFKFGFARGSSGSSPPSEGPSRANNFIGVIRIIMLVPPCWNWALYRVLRCSEGGAHAGVSTNDWMGLNWLYLPRRNHTRVPTASSVRHRAAIQGMPLCSGDGEKTDQCQW